MYKVICYQISLCSVYLRLRHPDTQKTFDMTIKVKDFDNQNIHVGDMVNLSVFKP